MKAKHAVLMIVAVTLGLVLQSGCGESRKKEQPPVGIQNPPEQLADVTPAPAVVQEDKGVPKIEVAKPVFDFGVVGPSKQIPCEFTFKNVGTGTLVVTKILSTCACTVPALKKKEYAPGESGVIKATYRSSATPIAVAKHLYIMSNDKTTPRFEVTIKGRVELKVAIEPKGGRLSLFLNRENGGATPITLTSKDKKPFAVKSFTSTQNAMTVDLDPTAEKMVHVLKPKVDVDKLKTSLKGSISIGLSHPETNRVTLSWSVLPLYTVSPPRIILQSAQPGKVVKRDIWVKSNYQEKVEIESATSAKGYIKVIERESKGTSLKLAVEITPPPQTSKTMRYIADKLTIKLKDGQTLFVTCSGWYARTSLQ